MNRFNLFGLPRRRTMQQTPSHCRPFTGQRADLARWLTLQNTRGHDRKRTTTFPSPRASAFGCPLAVLGWVLGLTCSTSLFAATARLVHLESANVASGRASITTNELRDHVYLLADDSLEGREAGSRGGYAAANFLLQQIKADLEPAGSDGTYFQSFPPRYRNILGQLPGGDPALGDQYIVVGAHYDHVGFGAPNNSRGPVGLIHNGADDNASGAAALLEVIQAFAESGIQPRRSILFAFWDGEEKGLLGSKHWNQFPTVDTKQIRLAVNVDMIGHLDRQPLQIIGWRSSPGLRWLMTQANYGNDLRLDFPWTVKENSDHHSFFSRNIPILMFHTGLHDDYHRPTDDAETLDMEGLKRASRFLFHALLTLGNAERLGPFRVASRHENERTRRRYERPLPQPEPRLGIRWKQRANLNATAPGLRVTHVTLGSAADHAGVRTGDRIVAVDGEPLSSAMTLKRSVIQQSAIELTVSRDGGTETAISVPLPGPATRIGISWRANPAEPGAVTIVRVIKHSRADRAGVQIGDRIHQVDDQPFRDATEFSKTISSIRLPTSVLVERDGQIRELMIGADG